MAEAGPGRQGPGADGAAEFAQRRTCGPAPRQIRRTRRPSPFKVTDNFKSNPRGANKKDDENNEAKITRPENIVPFVARTPAARRQELVCWSLGREDDSM